eukprot:scaffold2790_cov239-Pinguiococcus_pyrenoidosus.AAC.11
MNWAVFLLEPRFSRHFRSNRSPGIPHLAEVFSRACDRILREEEVEFEDRRPGEVLLRVSRALLNMTLEAGSCTMAELEFLAMETIVTIEPKFSHSALRFISGTFGPFEARVNEAVPLWLALTLKKRQRCRILPPAWMRKEALRDILDQEQAEGVFTSIDYYYQEISDALFKSARDDINDADEVQALIEDIANVRQAKIRHGLKDLAKSSLDETTWSVQLTNMSAMELFLIKDLLPEALNNFIDFSRSGAIEAQSAASQAAATPRFADVETSGGVARRLRRFRSSV